MVDALEWLEKHRASRFIADRGRGVALVEPMTAGDVFDDGSILTISGIVIARGAHVWLNDRKAAAARYYGWKEMGRWSTCPMTGETLYLLAR